MTAAGAAGPDEARLLEAATALLVGPCAPRRLGLAVSGGADSVAMLRLLAPFARDRGLSLAVATIDHGLRPESAEEAAFVAALCAALGVPHATLRWSGWDGRGNLPARARDARRALLSAWARGVGTDAVALAHTADDQAETVLMRLARGAGVDGLAGMAPDSVQEGTRWLRPLLGLGRQELRAWLRSVGQGWREDPSNADPHFERTRARAVLAALAPLGIDAESLLLTSVRMRWAREALDVLAADAAGRVAAVTAGGDVILDVAGLDRLPYETQLRLLGTALAWVAPQAPPPRLLALRAFWSEGLMRPRTLGGALLRRRRRPDRLVLGREPRAALRAPAVAPDALWDGRWRLDGPQAPELTLRALGEAGLALCPDWRATGLERPTLLASPALWDGERLAAAPLAGHPEGWTARLSPPPWTLAPPLSCPKHPRG